MNPLARKDLFVCLGIWLALEIIGFGLLPLLNLQFLGDRAELWLVSSLPIGIGGAFLMASSTQLTTSPPPVPRRRTQRMTYQMAAGLLSWLGLLGIGFPLLVISLQLCSQLLATLGS